MLNHQQKLGEKVVVTSGDKLRRGGYLKYDLELRESDAVSLSVTQLCLGVITHSTVALLLLSDCV